MNVSVTSRAYRILKDLQRYRDVATRRQELAYSTDIEDILYGEYIVGVYENDPGSLENGLIISNYGLRLRRDAAWSLIPYAEMSGVNFEQAKDATVTGLVVGTQDGGRVKIPVTGGDPNTGTRDAAEFMRFLLRVIGDVKAEREGRGGKGEEKTAM